MSWSYGRCSECTGKRQVFPCGPTDTRIMLIGEGPGKNEDKDGIPFVGVSGREQDHTYFSLAGLRRRDIFITNCMQCRCERGGMDVRPSAVQLAACVPNHLAEEIWTVNPEIVILAGATACGLIGSNLELEHGFPTYYKGSGLFGWEGVVVPMYHPAAGLRETRFMIPLLEDWKNLGKWLRGEWNPPIPTADRLDYRLLKTEAEVWATMTTESDTIAIDTESDDGQLYSIQFSSTLGTGYMILAQDKELLDAFATALVWGYNTVILHNSVYDLAELSTVGIHIPAFRDTMQELYHLGGSQPQGLKQAVYRIFGYRMTSYDEVVTPASKAKLDDWLAEALAFATQSMRESTYHLKGKGCPECGKNHRADAVKYKAHESEAVIRRVMKHLYKKEDNGFSEYDPWKPPTWAKGELKLRLFGRDWLGHIEQHMGRMPRKSIVHAPLDRQIQYACGDADWTGRLAKWLEGERERLIREEWRVA